VPFPRGITRAGRVGSEPASSDSVGGHRRDGRQERAGPA
jgi:hypothetical protein